MYSRCTNDAVYASIRGTSTESPGQIAAATSAAETMASSRPPSSSWRGTPARTEGVFNKASGPNSLLLLLHGPKSIEAVMWRGNARKVEDYRHLWWLGGTPEAGTAGNSGPVTFGLSVSMHLSLAHTHIHDFPFFQYLKDAKSSCRRQHNFRTCVLKSVWSYEKVAGRESLVLHVQPYSATGQAGLQTAHSCSPSQA